MTRRRRVRRSSKIDQKVIDGYFPPAFPGFLIAEEVKALVGTLRVTVEELTEGLLPLAQKRAIVPISNFKVGVICRGVSGNLYFGANIEFAGESLEATVHAEQASIANAISRGERGVRAITSTTVPCGACRQFINELNTAGELTIQLPKHPPTPFRELIPNGFSPGELNVESRLMDPQHHQLELESPDSSKTARLALEAANRSYAPYTHCYSGVALEMVNGELFSGSYAENAAFNPSLPALQAAIVTMSLAGKSYGEIRRMVLVQVREAKIDPSIAARQLTRSISAVPLEVLYAKRSDL